jgi:hypothetical protein
MKTKALIFLSYTFIFLFSGIGNAQQLVTKNDTKNEQVVFGNSKIEISLDYHQKCNISCLEVNGEKVIEGASGVFTQIKTLQKNYSTLHLNISPKVEIANNIVKVSGIIYGDNELKIREDWKFTITKNDIIFNIVRTYPKSFVAEEISYPSFNFKSISVWEGSFLEFGGVAWFYLFRDKPFTYGVHSKYAAFWNSVTGNGLKIDVESPGNQVASSYARSTDDKLVYKLTVSNKEMAYKYDSGTYRRRSLHGMSDVWAAVNIAKGTVNQTIRLTPFDYQKEYGRGKFVGIDGVQVTSVFNTIARIGVIDAKHFGGNSWHTPYGPICLHEQYIAQLGVAINDEHYMNGYKQCLDFYRDNAFKSDGRVISRWAYDNSDAMAGTATPEGFYEAQWGYLMDSNPDFVTNVAELYDQCGDKSWVAKQKVACEKALDYMLKRDVNGNHLVEVMTDSEIERKGSDWLDIVWASFENAFVNAKLYHALVLWADIEKHLGDHQKAEYYKGYAAKLKESFNKSTCNGGFWDEDKQCYIHWRDKDNILHGNNVVIPINFMAIAYGICDDKDRSKIILDQVEAQMVKENLFIWPCCMYSYQKGEVNDWQIPFPKYENGDIFLSWGEVGVQAYAAYEPELALKYVENVLRRHKEDGLAFQRYGRAKQDGLGDDILSGNSLAVVGLYHAIYGINPLYNRLYLNPHITDKLVGTEIIYNYRGEKFTISLDKMRYSVSNRQYTITAPTDFGFYTKTGELSYFNAKADTVSLKAKTENGKTLNLEIVEWDRDKFSWIYSAPNSKTAVTYTIHNLKPGHQFIISTSGPRLAYIKKSSPDGTLTFSMEAIEKPKMVIISERVVED